jgi:hypothetical protein
VVYSKCREKLAPYKIEGQAKPFVDKDLQLQLPEWDCHNDQAEEIVSTFSPIYSHYAGSCLPTPQSTSSLSLQINEGEFYRAMAEAELSYTAWKKMQRRIKKAAQSYRSA